MALPGDRSTRALFEERHPIVTEIMAVRLVQQQQQLPEQRRVPQTRRLPGPPAREGEHRLTSACPFCHFIKMAEASSCTHSSRQQQLIQRKISLSSPGFEQIGRYNSWKVAPRLANLPGRRIVSRLFNGLFG